MSYGSDFTFYDFQHFALGPFGGGGNGATAGAQIKGKPLRQVLQDLVGAIDAFYA